MLKFIRSLFTKKKVEEVKPAPAQGVVARKESDLSVVIMIHNGGDLYEVFVISKTSGGGVGCFRRGEYKAKQQFDFYCSTHNAK